jgi:hypothetical protein
MSVIACPLKWGLALRLVLRFHYITGAEKPEEKGPKMVDFCCKTAKNQVKGAEFLQNCQFLASFPTKILTNTVSLGVCL